MQVDHLKTLASSSIYTAALIRHVFTKITNQMFSVHTTREESENFRATLTVHFGFVFDETSDGEIVLLS